MRCRSVELKKYDRQRIGENKILVLESPEKVIKFFGGLSS
jgi:hypothetical protein